MTPEEIAKLNQGSIDTANRLNASAGVPTTLTSQNMSSASPVVLPTKTDNTDYQSILNGATSQVNSIQSQLDKYNTDQANQAKIAADTAKTPDTTQSLMDKLKGLFPGAPAQQTYNPNSNTDVATAKADLTAKNQAVQSATDELNNINAQIKQITDQATAIPIQAQTDATGRGITSAGLAPITSAQLRDNALKAIPLQGQAYIAQAKLASANGNATIAEQNLQMAQQTYDKAFSVAQDNAKTDYQYQLDKYNAISDLLTKEDAKIVDAQKTELATNNTNYNNFVNDVRATAATAIANSDGNTASQLNALVANLNPNSSTFNTDYTKAQQTFATLSGQIQAKPKVTTTPNTLSAPIKSGTLVYTPQDQASDSQALDASRGSDNYVDPTLYQNLYKLWIAHGGQLEDFLKTYPPKNYVNPANTWLPEFLMPTKSSSSSSGIVNPFK